MYNTGIIILSTRATRESVKIPKQCIMQQTSITMQCKLPEGILGNSIYLLTGYKGIESLLSPRPLTIDRGGAEVNSQSRGDNKLAIPEYTVYKYFIIPKNITLIAE